MNTAMSADAVLAASTSGSGGIIALIIGIVVVVILIGAFVWGSRRREREPAPLPVARDLGESPSATDPEATADRAAPDSGSWAAPPGTPGEAPHGR